MQVLLCAVQLGRLGKFYSFCDFLASIGKKKKLFGFGNDTENRSRFNSEKITASHNMHLILLYHYSALAKLVHSRKRNLSEDYRREWLRNVKSTISASAKRFSGYGQHVS